MRKPEKIFKPKNFDFKKKTMGGFWAQIYSDCGGGRYIYHGSVYVDGMWLNVSWDKEGIVSPCGIRSGAKQYDLISKLKPHKHSEDRFWKDKNSERS